jgi:hypothetical protein
MPSEAPSASKEDDFWEAELFFGPPATHKSRARFDSGDKLSYHSSCSFFILADSDIGDDAGGEATGCDFNDLCPNIAGEEFNLCRGVPI